MTPEQFRSIRKTRLRLSQTALGAVLGIGIDQVGRYEKGTHPITPRTAYAMAWLACHGTADPFADGWRLPGLEPDL